MAHFDKEELSECIRHNMAMLDDTGLTGRIVVPPRRRTRPGGFPLEMCRKTGGEGGAGGSREGFGEEDDSRQEEEEEASASIVFQLDRAQTSQAPAVPIRDQIRARLLGKLREMEQSGRVNKAAQPVAQRPTECTIRFEPKQIGGVGQEQKKNERRPPAASLTSRLLAETKFEDDDTQTFAEFAKFEAMDVAIGSKRFTILFPFAEQPRCAIPIKIVRTATIAELIGLACHIYTREQREPPCDLPSEYDLYLAEEDLEDFDTELPPQDRRRRVGECGFPNLAMVKRSTVYRRPSQRIQNHQINIYLVDGRCYGMEADSLDISLRQVLEYGLERKKDDDEQSGRGTNLAFFRKLDYVLEPLEQPGSVLDLNGSVSSSGANDFVLLRMNSARGDLLMEKQSAVIGRRRHIQTRSMEFNQFSLDIPNSRFGGSKPYTSGIPEIDWTKRRTRFSVRQPHSQQQQHQAAPYSAIESMATLGRRSGAELAQMVLDQALLDGGALLEQFQVNRIHRFQPKTPIRLVVRERCLELIPVQPPPIPPPVPDEPRKKRAATPMDKSAKAKKIPWELIATIEVPPNSEQRPNARRIVRIISLSGISPLLLQHIIDSGKGGKPPQGGYSAYDRAYWKTFLVEAAADEAWQIGVRLSELLDSHPSQVHMLYNFSSGATLKPQSAAEKAFCATKALPKTGAGHSPGNSSILGGESSNNNGPERGQKKKLSMIFSRMRL